MENLISRRDVLKNLGFSNTTLDKLVDTNQFPQKLRVMGSNQVWFNARDVHEWLENRRIVPK